MEKEYPLDDQEKKPLLEDKTEEATPTSPEGVPKRCFLVGPVLLLMVFSFAMQGLVLVQYSYFAFTKMYFPADTGNLSTITQETTCTKDNSSSEEREARAKIQTLASNLNIYLTLALAIPNVFSNLAIGSLSDVYGRKIFICIAMIGYLVKSLCLTLSIFFEINIYLFVLFSFVDGCTGSVLGAITAMLAFVADCTSPGRPRVIFITVLEMLLGIGALIGALVSGYFIKASGYVIPNIVISAIMVFAVFLVVCFLPETLQKQNKRPKGSVCKKLSDILRFYIKGESHEDNRCVYIISISIVVCMGLCNHGRTNVETLYQLNTPFCWNSVLVGWYLAIRLAAQTVIGVMLIRLFMCCMGDELIASFGAVSSTASFIIEALATKSIELILVPVVGVGSMITSPIVKGFMSKITPANKQGTLFASIGFVEAWNNLVGTLVFNSIYSATVGTMKSLVFYVMASISGLAVILLIILKIINTVKKETAKPSGETLNVSYASSSASTLDDDKKESSTVKFAKETDEC